MHPLILLRLSFTSVAFLATLCQGGQDVGICHHKTMKTGHSGDIYCQNITEPQNWRIAVEKTKIVKFIIREFQTVPCSNCSIGNPNCDSLIIYNGRKIDNSEVVLHICSFPQGGGNVEVRTSDHVAFVHFELAKSQPNFQRNFLINFKGDVNTTVGEEISQSSGATMVVGIVVAVGTGIFVLLGIAIGFYCYYCRGKDNEFRKQELENNTVQYNDSHRNSSLRTNLLQNNQNETIGRHYHCSVIEEQESETEEENKPLINDTVFDLPYTHNELEFSQLRLEKEPIGIGSFGVIYMGVCMEQEFSSEPVKVAVKRLRKASESYRQALEAEVKLTSYLNPHPYIIDFVGAITKPDNQYTIVAYYCELGPLHHYIRRFKHIDPTIGTTQCKPPVLSIGDMLYWAERIANAISYMHFKNCAHRDLAARNVLLTAELTPKLADFGVCRTLNPAAFFDEKIDGDYAWKWAAIEVLEGDFFELKSDVWSFGVLLWELFSLGHKPFTEFNRRSEEFINALQNGTRLPKPNVATPGALYSLMIHCWRIIPSDRPSFSELERSLLTFRTMR